MVSHPLNQCFVVREKINEMWKNGVITFDKNYGPASVNMVSYGQTSKSPKEKITTSFKVIKMTLHPKSRCLTQHQKDNPYGYIPIS